MANVGKALLVVGSLLVLMGGVLAIFSLPYILNQFKAQFASLPYFNNSLNRSISNLTQSFAQFGNLLYAVSSVETVFGIVLLVFFIAYTLSNKRIFLGAAFVFSILAFFGGLGTNLIALAGGVLACAGSYMMFRKSKKQVQAKQN